jgi:prephenate dehydrogenase
VGDEAAVEAVAGIHAALGAEVIRCASAEHDAAVAMVSHLPYLVASAFALAAREAGPLAERLAGPGLRDLTRLAQFPFDIQGEVARRNDGIADAASALKRQLERVLGAVAASPETARAVLEDARAAREALYPGGKAA